MGQAEQADPDKGGGSRCVCRCRFGRKTRGIPCNSHQQPPEKMKYGQGGYKSRNLSFVATLHTVYVWTARAGKVAGILVIMQFDEPCGGFLGHFRDTRLVV